MIMANKEDIKMRDFFITIKLFFLEDSCVLLNVDTTSYVYGKNVTTWVRISQLIILCEW